MFNSEITNTILGSGNQYRIGYSICFNNANMKKIEFENAIQK